MQSAEITIQNFIATPVAGFLFAFAIVLPIWLTGAGFLVAGMLALSIPAAAAHAHARRDAAGPTRRRTSPSRRSRVSSGSSGRTASCAG